MRTDPECASSGTLLASVRIYCKKPAPRRSFRREGRVRRQRLLLIITILSPLLLLGMIEGGLRIAGLGRLEPLFVPVAAAPGYLQPNPEVIRRFFPDPGAAPDVSIDTT